MGYTHYWRSTGKPVDPKKFEAFSEDCAHIVRRTELRGIRLAYEYDRDSIPPVTDVKLVQFNGVGEEGYETFRVSLDLPEFDFCKTAREPYDVAVCACLIALKHHLKGAVRVTSDGSDEEGGPWDGWTPARALCQEACGYGLDYYFGANGLTQRRKKVAK